MGCSLQVIYTHHFTVCAVQMCTDAYFLYLTDATVSVTVLIQRDRLTCVTVKCICVRLLPPPNIRTTDYFLLFKNPSEFLWLYVFSIFSHIEMLVMLAEYMTFCIAISAFTSLSFSCFFPNL